MSRVVLAMSGGVDSSVAALLLRQQGYEVIGLFMRSGAETEATCATAGTALPILGGPGRRQGCCSSADAADARRAADKLDLPFYAVNFQESFDLIKDYFVEEYLAGRTPNPCVMCNNWLKFGKLWQFARQVGAQHIATGHYARLAECPGEEAPALLRGLDAAKDQSYVLFGIDRQILSRVLFPVGEYQKSHIRDLARAAGLQVAEKPDSQEICFVPDQDYTGFVRRRRAERDTSGELVDTAGNVVGSHDGYERFTVGQRRGLGVGFGAPRYVVELRPETRQVVIGTREELACGQLEAGRLNWLVAAPPEVLRCHAQIRYRQRPAAATARLLASERLSVQFDEPQFGVAPGQAVVLYDQDRVLGGGWIEQATRLLPGQ
jgi:tRNA-specific 2-thiouridylase